MLTDNGCNYKKMYYTLVIRQWLGLLEMFGIFSLLLRCDVRVMYLQSFQCASSIAHMPGKFFSRPHSSLFSTSSNVSRSSVGFGLPMSCRHSMETPPFHNSLKSPINSANTIQRPFVPLICSFRFSQDH